MSTNKAKATGVDPRTSKKQKVSVDEGTEEDQKTLDSSRVRSLQDGVSFRECQDAPPAITVSDLAGDGRGLSDACQTDNCGEPVNDAAEDKNEEAPRNASSELLLNTENSKGLESSMSPCPTASSTVDDTAVEASDEVLKPKPSSPVVNDEPPSNLLSTPTSESLSPTVNTLAPTISMSPDEAVLGTSQDDEDDAGQYDLKKIMTLQELQKEDCICCSQEGCGGLPAFGLYVNSINPQDRWYYCLDCQQNDFEGWPPVDELPVKYLAPEHIRVMAQKCSRSKNPPMPVFEHSPKPNSTTLAADPPANFVTPPPSVSVMQSKSMPPTKALEVHKKWLEAAQSMGGTDARIVVSKPAAKKLIFDFLVNTFQPMNITQIYMGLKAVVPQPVLNACLQEMVPDQFSAKSMFHDSDDEDEETKKDEHAKSEPYSGSLVFKPGKNLSTNLYYCDYTKIKGMDRHELDSLLNDLANAKAEKEHIEVSLKATRELAAMLFSEPTNEELHLQLAAQETLLQELEEEVVEARKLTINEKHKQNTKKHIEKMAVAWRSRRRSCLDFLTSMEESSEGQISRAKCLKGDGPITIDSDEMVAKAALLYAKGKKEKATKTGGLQHKPMKSLKSVSSKGGGASGPAQGLTSDLVAVNLDAQLNIVRIFADSTV